MDGDGFVVIVNDDDIVVVVHDDNFVGVGSMAVAAGNLPPRIPVTRAMLAMLARTPLLAFALLAALVFASALLAAALLTSEPRIVTAVHGVLLVHEVLIVRVFTLALGARARTGLCQAAIVAAAVALALTHAFAVSLARTFTLALVLALRVALVLGVAPGVNVWSYVAGARGDGQAVGSKGSIERDPWRQVLNVLSSDGRPRFLHALDEGGRRSDLLEVALVRSSRQRRTLREFVVVGVAETCCVVLGFGLVSLSSGRRCRADCVVVIVDKGNNLLRRGLRSGLRGECGAARGCFGVPSGDRCDGEERQDAPGVRRGSGRRRLLWDRSQPTMGSVVVLTRRRNFGQRRGDSAGTKTSVCLVLAVQGDVYDVLSAGWVDHPWLWQRLARDTRARFDG